MKTLQIIKTKDYGTLGQAYALIDTDTKEVLYSHLCSSIHYAKGDLIDHRPERQQILTEKYGEYKVIT